MFPDGDRHGGQHDHGNAFPVLIAAAGPVKGQAALLRHHDVHQDQVDFMGVHRPQGLFAVVGPDSLIAFAG